MARLRADDYHRKREELLEDAAQVFATLGAESASMAQIASRAKVSKSLLYHYYPSKNALIFAILERRLGRLEAALELVDRPDLTAESRLDALVRTLLDQLRGDGNPLKTLISAAHNLPDAEREAISAFERRIIGRFQAALRGVTSNQTSEHVLPQMTMALFGMLGWSQLWSRNASPVEREDYGKVVVTLLIGGSRRMGSGAPGTTFSKPG